MSNNNDDPFFKLLKNTYSYNKEPGDKRSLADLYSNFKETNNRYQQQNLNSFIRKPGNNGVNLNNYAFRTEYRPHDNMKLEFYERADPNYVEEEDRAHDNPFGDRSDTEIMTEDIEDVDEDEEQQDEQEEEMELEEEHKEEQKPGGVVPDVTVSPLKANQNHLQSFAYQKGKTRQPTLKELLSKTGKIKKKDGADAENGKKMNKGEAKTAPPPKPKEPTKEERMEMLKNELKKKAMVEKEQQRKNAFEAEEARKKIAMQAKQKEKMMKEYRQKMKDDEQARLASLLKSNGQILGNNVKDLNQAINKQRKNTDPLIKFFLAYKYFDPEGFALPTYPIGNEFEDYLAYQQAFQPMIMNEYIANIKSSLQPVVRQSSNTKSVRCMMRIHNTSGNEEDDYTIIELKESKSKDDNDQILSFQNKNINEVFDLSFANNYLILITSTKTIVKEQINSDDYKKGFAFVGYISSEGKSNIMETPKAFIIANYPKLKKYLKSEWASCYVRPIEKITTFLREYISLNCFVYSDVNQYVFRPREVSNIIDFDHTELYEKFFNSIRPKYNQGQMDSIQDVCLSRNGICLLQGPPGTGKTHTLLGIVSGIYHYLKSSQTTHRQYIMICTPSNTAIDEIILRLKQHGLYNENGEIIKPNVVRVGILDKDPHELVKQCALENLAQKEMLRLSGASNPREEATMNELRDEIAKLSKKIEVLRLDPEGDKQELKGLYEKRRALHSQYHDHKTMQVGEKERYSQVVQNILYSADIICCTLTSAGSEKLERFRDYVEAVIVDEASQCTEPSNIIPLQYSPKKLILIGDPKQLPATTFSNDSHVTRFNRSLFERVIDCGVKPFFLYEQYRMISNIRKFPSYYFYEDRLTDAPSVLARKFPPYLANLETRNVLFLDLKFSREVSSDKSYYNSSEIAMAMGILEFLIKKLTASNQSTKHLLGCITPYKKQVIALNEKLRDKYGMKYRDHVTVNTVDAFQGQEKDVILFSTVRASAHAGESDDHNLIGFLSDVRRLNVAITRPKFVLIVIGNSNTLATNETWRSYIEHLIKNKCYVNVPEASEIDKVIRILFRGDKIPDHLTKPPDLPKVTPKRTKKEPSVHTISSGEGNADQPKSRRSENDSKEGSAKPIRRQLSKKGSFSKPKRKQDEEEEKDEKQNESLLSEGDMEKIHKKVKPHEEVPNLRREDKSTVASKGSATTMSTEPSFGGLGSLFGGSAGGADQKKKQEDAGAGLSSLFSGGSTKPKKKEPEDNSHSILNRLFNI